SPQPTTATGAGSGTPGVSTVSPSAIPTVEATTVEETSTAPGGDGDAAEGAPSAAAEEAPTGTGHDLSPWGMYQAADIIVKGVMIGLVFACFVTWTVWLAKSIEIWLSKRKLRNGIKRIASAESLT